MLESNVRVVNGLNLVEEWPVAININEINYAVMMLSPFNLDDFSVGFLFTSGVINQLHDIKDVQIHHQTDHIQLNVTIANRCFAQLKFNQRQLKGIAGCGLCGTRAIEQAFPPIQALAATSAFDIHQLEQIKSQLPEWQTQAKQSGALHAAFWLNHTGEIIACREDIGRHNALDKLIGASIKAKWDKQGAAILMTSRCSVELVQKAIAVKVNNLISLASPSQFALKLAKQAGLHLIHIPRKDKPIYYS